MSIRSRTSISHLTACVLALTLCACRGPRATAKTIEVEIVADGTSQMLAVPSGATVQQALESSGVTLNALDQVDPPGYVVVADGTRVKITRVEESFEIEEIVIPFERQTIRNESLPEGETRLLQPGSNGTQEVTYRIIHEEGVEISRTPVKNVVIQQPIPEIIMVGLQSAYTPLAIEGKLAYVSSNNAWTIQGDTGNRRPLILSGDLDGRVFQLSPDGRWLLFTRQAEQDDEFINSLWVISTSESDAEPVDLKARNIVHFADWVPSTSTQTVSYSTVEPSPAAPGWQANNDLIFVSFTKSGVVMRPTTILESNAGGQYGWWGTHFAWGGDERHLAYARADGIGWVDFENQRFEQLHDIVPYQTLSDWAWVPGLAWGQDNRTLLFIDHGKPIGLESAGSSPVFNLIAMAGKGGVLLPLSTRTGMFAYPAVSPVVEQPSGEISYRIAFLQAISPLESEDSGYRLWVMDRDGSNLQTLFPAQGEVGLQPHQVVWSPGADRLALIYRGDLWVIDAVNGVGQRITGDGQTSNFNWSP